MKKAMKGNQVLAYAVSQANVKIIPVFPITPQTSIIETLAELIKEKKFQAAYIPMESEHSVMAACIGASNTGVRTFTATSGQGLLYMHELLHWASGGRLPIVMGVVNRAVAPGWNIWMDQTDTVSQRDTGWIQIYCTNHQELYDHLFIAYKLSEKLLLPSMVIQDAFFLSHTTAEVEIEEQEKIDTFLPKEPNIPFAFDFENPKTLGSLSDASNYMEFRYQIESAFQKIPHELKNIYEEFEKIFNRKYQLLESFRVEDAETVFILSGTVYETALSFVEEMRKKGFSIGAIKIRFLRPFLREALLEKIIHKKNIIIIDRNYSFGMGGVFGSEVKALLGENFYQLQPNLKIFNVIAGLGGRDITHNTLQKILTDCLNKTKSEDYWEDYY